MSERFSLNGKVAVVTGGSRGIGRAIASGLAAAGASVVVASRDAARCEAVAAELRATGTRSLGVACDVSREDDLRRLFGRVKTELSGTDVFVHCAGVSTLARSIDVSRSDMQSMLDLHLLGGVTGAQLAAAQMMERGGGAMVLVSSIWALGGRPQSLAYGTAKAALAQAVRVFAVEWASKGIRVNGLAPGFVETDMTASVTDDPALRERALKRIPLKRAATPDEMAGPAVFLCSPAASFVTGHLLVVDGGERAT